MATEERCAYPLCGRKIAPYYAEGGKLWKHISGSVPDHVAVSPEAVEPTCATCGGSGIVTGSEHAPKCDGYTCAPDCPIPVPLPCPDHPSIETTDVPVGEIVAAHQECYCPFHPDLVVRQYMTPSSTELQICRAFVDRAFARFHEQMAARTDQFAHSEPTRGDLVKAIRDELAATEETR